MDPRITLYGIAGIGASCGYLLLFILKRYLPPIHETLPPLKQAGSFVVALAGGAAVFGIGVGFAEYIGPYGIGLFTGLMINVLLTLLTELVYHWTPRLLALLS